MKRMFVFASGMLCGFVAASLMRGALVGRAMYQRGHDAGVSKVQAEAIARGYAVITALEDWAAEGAKPREVRREFQWLPPDVIERELKAIRP